MIRLTEKEKADRFDSLQTAFKVAKESYERRRADADNKYRNITLNVLSAYNKGLEVDDMNKMPENCGESVLASGIPICRIECIPCARVKECPLEKKVDMSMWKDWRWMV